MRGAQHCLWEDGVCVWGDEDPFLLLLRPHPAVHPWEWVERTREGIVDGAEGRGSGNEEWSEGAVRFFGGASVSEKTSFFVYLLLLDLL